MPDKRKLYPYHIDLWLTSQQGINLNYWAKELKVTRSWLIREILSKSIARHLEEEQQ
jgi:hypothetical protein